jgi:hypothetical protein
VPGGEGQEQRSGGVVVEGGEWGGVELKLDGAQQGGVGEDGGRVEAGETVEDGGEERAEAGVEVLCVRGVGSNRCGVEGDVVGGGVHLQLRLKQTVRIVVEGVRRATVVECEMVV